jgi:hypothetical protein
MSAFEDPDLSLVEEDYMVAVLVLRANLKYRTVAVSRGFLNDYVSWVVHDLDLETFASLFPHDGGVSPPILVGFPAHGFYRVDLVGGDRPSD